MSIVLYKKDSKGRIRMWKGWVEGGDTVTESGVNGGKTVTRRTTCKPSKTMDSHEVAKSKIISTSSKKLKEGYFKTAEEAEAYVETRCMLLHSWKDSSDKMCYPAIIMPKLDGVCGIYMDEPRPYLKSREDNEFEKLSDMALAIQRDLAVRTCYYNAHGEIYHHGAKVSEIVEAIKGDNEELRKLLRFYVYDYMGPELDSLKYIQRLYNGLKVFHRKDGAMYIPVKTGWVETPAQVEEAKDIFCKMGFEGAVVCNRNGLYEYGRRSYDKLKVKQLFSEEFQIVGWETEIQDGLELILFQCITAEGTRFNVRPAWAHKRRAEAMHDPNKFLGKKATVEFRSWTKYNLPFHPVLVSIRDYE